MSVAAMRFPDVLALFQTNAAMNAAPVVFHPGKPAAGRVVFVISAINSYCHKHGHSVAVSRGAIAFAMVQLRGNADRDDALSSALKHADELHVAEVDRAFAGRRS